MSSRTKDVEINLRAFDIKRIKQDAIIILLGRRSTGKSVMVRDILYHNRHIPIGTVISRTDHLVHFYDKFIPGMLIHKRYEPVILDKVFKRQEKAIAEKWANPNSFLLLDDCLPDAKNFNKDERVDEIFYNGRHYKLLFILTMQTPTAIPPGFRTNTDFTFILKNTNGDDREKLFKNYANMFETREQFEIVLDSCTEDYNCLVIDNTTKSNKLEDQVFYYKAGMHEDFRICSNSVWQINSQNFNNTVETTGHTTTVVNTKNGKGKVIIKKKVLKQ